MENNYYTYESKYVPSAFGLNNIGAICWCNSLIQLMLGLPSLNRTLLECEARLVDNKFAVEYIKVLRATLPSDDPNLPPIDTGRLLSASAAVLGAMLQQMKLKGLKLNMGMGQECADEAFILFIEMFECTEVENLFSNVYELTIECTGCNKRVSSIRDKSYRIQLFTPVELSTKEKFCTYLRIHPSEHDYYKCDCGTTMSKFYRAERLKMLREIVVIIFNKFQMKDKRWFPSTLSFNGVGGKVLNYKLVGKIEHAGTMSSGHYWSHSLRDGKWFRLNDTGVTTGHGEPTPETFMIAYHMISEDI